MKRKTICTTDNNWKIVGNKLINWMTNFTNSKKRKKNIKFSTKILRLWWLSGINNIKDKNQFQVIKFNLHQEFIPNLILKTHLLHFKFHKFLYNVILLGILMTNHLPKLPLLNIRLGSYLVNLRRHLWYSLISLLDWRPLSIKSSN